ncbi:MAG: alpha/beta fold hydrolase [Acidobacteriota bacterium]|nr:alpha/beta fold hydrolase [Acidobacteriota bacterium]
MSAQPESDTIVLLHGFAGTRHTWDRVRDALGAGGRRSLALDLPGHGSRADRGTVGGFAGCAEQVLAAAPPRFALCGYSLGGRVALHVALAAPQRVARLVLVSTSAGIADEHERERRREADERLAEALVHEPFERFVAGWSDQPLFAEDPAAVRAAAQAEQSANDPRALAAVLRELGAGTMEPLWDRLGELDMPAHVVVGERDGRYRAIGREMAARMPDARLTVIGGGHRLALESPAALAAAIGAPGG